MSPADRPTSDVSDVASRAIAARGEAAGLGRTHPGERPRLAPADEPDPAAHVAFYSLRDMLAIAAHHRRVALLGLLLGVFAGIVALVVTPTQYTATSLLMVLIGRESASPQDVAGIGPGSLSVDGLKVLQSEITIVESVDVIERALRAVGPERVFPELARGRLLGLLPPRPKEQTLSRAAELLRRRLFAADSQNGTNNGLFNGSNIMRVSVALPDRTLAVETLNALVAAYLEHRRDIFASPGDAFLKAELGKVESELKTVEAAIQRTRTETGVLEITQDITLASARLDSLLARENEARARQQAVAAEIAAASDQLRRLPERVFASREATNQPPNDDARNTLLKLQLERAHLVQQYTPTWPAVLELDRKIAAVQAVLRGESSRPGSYTQRDVRNPSADVLNTRLVSLQVESHSLDTQLAELERQYQQAGARVAQLRDADQRLHDLDRRRGVLENVQRQLALREANVRVQDTVTAARNANVNVVQSAEAPFTGSDMGLSYLAAFSFAGLMAGLAAALVAGRLRQVFVVAREAQRRLDLAVLAEFDDSDRSFEAAQSRRDLANLAASLIDEAVERPRHAGANGRRSATLLQVAGLEESATRVVAAALAREFAEVHGLRTLLVDVVPTAGFGLMPTQGETLPLTQTGTRNLWTSTGAAPALLRGRSPDLPVAITEAIDIVVAASPGTARDHTIRRIATLADLSALVIVAERTQALPAAELAGAVLAAGARIPGFVFTGRHAALPGFMQRWV